MLLAAKRDFYTDKIASCGSNQKQLFINTKSLIGVSCRAQLPSHVSSNDLARQFSSHLEKKVSDIQQIKTHRSGDRSYGIAAAFSDDAAFRDAQLTRFKVDRRLIVQVIRTIPTAYMAPETMVIWTCRYDYSYNKLLHVLRKRLRLMQMLYAATCAISNLQFLSKFVEKVMQYNWTFTSTWNP